MKTRSNMQKSIPGELLNSNLADSYGEKEMTCVLSSLEFNMCDKE